MKNKLNRSKRLKSTTCTLSTKTTSTAHKQCTSLWEVWKQSHFSNWKTRRASTTQIFMNTSPKSSVGNDNNVPRVLSTSNQSRFSTKANMLTRNFRLMIYLPRTLVFCSIKFNSKVRLSWCTKNVYLKWKREFCNCKKKIRNWKWVICLWKVWNKNFFRKRY